jgi:hypothetical protein
MPHPAVFKTAHVESLDEFFSGTPEELRAAYRYALDLMSEYDDRPLSEITAHIERANDAQEDIPRGPRDVGTASHFLEHWLADASPLGGKNVDRVFRHGYRTAIELALSHDEPLPIDTVWVSGVTDAFEIHVAEARRQVTVVVFIPVPIDDLTRVAGGAAKMAAALRSWGIYPDPAPEADTEVLEVGDIPIVKRQAGGPPETAA